MIYTVGEGRREGKFDIINSGAPPTRNQQTIVDMQSDPVNWLIKIKDRIGDEQLARDIQEEEYYEEEEEEVYEQ